MTQPVDTDARQRLITAIRGWVHMDNLAESFNRQAMNARQVRAKHEAEAIALMKQLGMSGSQIQISGGATLQLAHRRNSMPLTWSFLERELPKAGLSQQQAAGALTWLQGHRDVKEAEYLRKSVPGSKSVDSEKE